LRDRWDVGRPVLRHDDRGRSLRRVQPGSTAGSGPHNCNCKYRRFWLFSFTKHIHQDPNNKKKKKIQLSPSLPIDSKITTITTLSWPHHL
jgi:hypothetical protein